MEFERIKAAGTFISAAYRELVEEAGADIYFLVGVHSRLSVALSWLWVHLRNHRTARLITQDSETIRIE